MTILIFNFVTNYPDGYLNHEGTNHVTTSPFPVIGNVNDKLDFNGILKHLDIQEIICHNLQVKSAAYRAIKRPGRS